MANTRICPHCGVAGLRGSALESSYRHEFRDVVVFSVIVECPNPQCRNETIIVQAYKNLSRHNVETRFHQRVYPPPVGKRYGTPPVPASIVEDYTEAYQILTRSPKAAATLVRRAMQGVIRHFYGVSKGTLYAEIDAIKDVAEPTLWQAMDNVRKIGAIGAHMDRDIDLIVNIEPGEAEKLLELLEVMIDETFVAKQKRDERIKAVNEIAVGKAAERAAQKSAAEDGPDSDNGA